MFDVDRYGVMWKKSAPMMVTPTSATMNVQVKAGRLGNWTVIVFLPRWLTGVPLTACSIGLLDAGCAGCFCDSVAGSKLTAAPFDALKSRWPLAWCAGVVSPRTRWGALLGSVTETAVTEARWWPLVLVAQ
ncbi:hypothetical protein T08_12041 [Trichinella sp. T8]|nr:hypothetical protein T08_12041 [Trichinella sp. T8]